jgi:hypothetical protein
LSPVREAGLGGAIAPAAPPVPLVAPADPDLVIRQARARQRRRRRRTAAVVAAVMVTGGGLYLAVGGTGGAKPGPGRPAGPAPRVNPAAFPARWTIASSPGIGSQDNALNAVAGLSRRDAWAVGYHGRAGHVVTLAEHWDGQGWRIVPSPSPGENKNDEFLGTVALGPRDVWAVGYCMPARHLRTLIERFDGTHWAVVPSPRPAGADSRLAAVAGRSPHDLWAVGSAGPKTLIEHWDGQRWSIVPSPNAGPPDTLEGVAVLSRRDAWAVGASFYGARGPRPLILHWDGRRWAVASAPRVTGDLHAVAAIAPGDVWAVGELDTRSGGSRTLAERWDMTSWQVIHSPNASPSNNGSGELDAVAGVCANAVWAAGFLDHKGRFETLIQRWAGSGWTITASPNIKAQNNFLYGLGTAGNLVWTVGQHYLGRSQTLAEVHGTSR